jgi:hypothetical protein
VDDIQDVDFTGYFEVNDVIDVIDVDAAGNILSVLAENLSVLAIDPGVSLTLSASVDTTAAGGTPKIRCQEIDDGQSAVDRLYRKKVDPSTLSFQLRQGILAQQLNKPTLGQTTFEVADASFFRAGDHLDILADEGIIDADTVIVSVTPNADATNNRATVVVNEVIDTSTFTSPFMLNTTISLQSAIERNQERIDEIDRPIENENMDTLNGSGDRMMTAYETATLFRAGSTHVIEDGNKKRLGTAGTRASLATGAGDAALSFESMLLGLLGNEIRVQVVNAAGTAVTVTKSFKEDSKQIITALTDYLIQVNNASGVATAQEICDAINADSAAKRIVQAMFGGAGSGAVAAFGPTALTGGLNDGTGDYAELEQVRYNNDETLLVNTLTGYKWISFHIRPNERNRMYHPPEDDQELDISYRQPMENVDR